MTLIEELEQAEDRADARAIYWQSLGLEKREQDISRAEAAALRARAARIRELMATWERLSQEDEESVPVLDVLRALTGDLAAPGARKP
jgi:hypothetical protein